MFLLIVLSLGPGKKLIVSKANGGMKQSRPVGPPAPQGVVSNRGGPGRPAPGRPAPGRPAPSQPPPSQPVSAPPPPTSLPPSRTAGLHSLFLSLPLLEYH